MEVPMTAQADVTHNVRVLVARERNGRLERVSEKRFKNTATRLMTESICHFLAGAENTYKRGKGRPNYMGIGTMGISKQPYEATQTAEVVDNFSETTYVEGETTRPWFESTSLALTTVCGAINPDEDGISRHFWDATLGWGKDGFTGEESEEPIFQGELCTARVPDSIYNEKGDLIESWDTVPRVPILRADVLSDCPADWDYGVSGYSSQVIFYGYFSVEWVHKMLHPSKTVLNQLTGEYERITIGPQLDRMAVSEFGLYEKTNTDPHGLETMLAGFRVPYPEDVVYVSDGDVILVEWRVTVRALMPYEGVRVVTEPSPTGVSIAAEVKDPKHVQMYAAVRGEPGVRQGVTWSLPDQEQLAEGTMIDQAGWLTIDQDEPADIIYVDAASVVDPFIKARSAILTGLIKDLVTGISIATTAIDQTEIQLQATVLGKGTFSQNVVWTLAGNESPGTTIDQTGLVTLDFEEQSNELEVTATSVDNNRVKSVAAVVRIDKTSGAFTITNFTILTEGGESSGI